jgi:hAT family protein
MAAHSKLSGYYTLIRGQSHAVVATICDPRFNLNVFKILWPKQADDIKRARILVQFKEVFYHYQQREQKIKAATIQATVKEETIVLDVQEIDSEDELFAAQGDTDSETEWSRWIKQKPMPQNTNILKYWASKEYKFLVIAKMARDHLAILATSAPSECVFSVGSDIVTKKRNRLGGDNIRKLLCLRD